MLAEIFNRDGRTGWNYWGDQDIFEQALFAFGDVGKPAVY